MGSIDRKPRKKSSRPPPPAPPDEPTRDLSLNPTPPPELSVGVFTMGSEELAILSYPMTEDDLAKRLTMAEQEIVRALLSGKSNAQIAKERGSAERTVANQVASAYRKLAVRSRAELAARCAVLARSDA